MRRPAATPKFCPSAKAVTRDGILNLDEEQMKDVLRQMEEGVLAAMPPVRARKIDADRKQFSNQC